MAEVQWIKLKINMFDDLKIDFIESLPESDSILIIWIKLLTLAGKLNSNGYIFLTESLPYTDESLSHKLRRPLNTVRLALKTFQELGMIEIDENSRIFISNWDKHQNIDGMEKLREKERIRKQKQREKQKLLSQDNDGTSHGTVTQCHAIDKEKEEEKDINNKEEDANPITFYEENGFGTISPLIGQKINDWIEDGFFSHPKLTVMLAMEVSIINNVRKWSYVNSILNDWLQNNLKTIDQINAYLTEHQAKKQESSSKRKSGNQTALDELIKKYGD
jgi:predicted phage replisome organizer